MVVGTGSCPQGRSNDSDIPRNQQRSRLCDDIFRWKENPSNRATHGLPQRRVQISVSSQSSSRRLESSGLGQAVNVEHKNRRETPEHSSSSADMVLRKSGVGHEWNSMTLQAAATADAAESCQPLAKVPRVFLVRRPNSIFHFAPFLSTHFFPCLNTMF